MKARLTIFNGANRPEEAKRVLLAVPDLHSKRQDLRSRYDALRGVTNSLSWGAAWVSNKSQTNLSLIAFISPVFLRLELAWERRECDASQESRNRGPSRHRCFASGEGALASARRSRFSHPLANEYAGSDGAQLQAREYTGADVTAVLIYVFVPILLLWLIGSAILWTVRWVATGFRRG